MPVKINEIVRNDFEQPQVVVPFGAMDALLNSPLFPHGIAYLFGEDIREEIYAFHGVPTNGSTIAYGRGIFNDLRHRYRGQAELFNRMADFLRTRGVSQEDRDSVFDLSPDMVRAIAGYDVPSLIDRIADEYLATRRLKDGARAAMQEFLVQLTSQHMSGPVIVRHPIHWQLSYEVILTIAVWGEQGRAVPLIVAVDQLTVPESYAPSLSRDYIGMNDLIPLAVQALGKDEAALRNALLLWKASLYGDSRVLVGRGEFTAHLANRFLATAERLEPFEELESATNAIPSQRLAPLIFTTRDAEIDLADTPAQGIAPLQIIGAARALKNQALDVLSVGGLDNAIPLYRAKVLRIVGILDRVVSCGEPSQADVVELGVELSGIENRVVEGHGRIGELVVGEVLSFILNAKSFLNTFSDWEEYRRSVRIGSEDVAGQARLAMELLRAFAELPNGLTDQARERITSFASTDNEDLQDAAKREGYLASAENLTAEAGKQVLAELKAQAKATASEVTTEVRSKLAQNTAELIVKYAPKFAQLATARGGGWIEMLIGLVTRH